MYGYRNVNACNKKAYCLPLEKKGFMETHLTIYIYMGKLLQRFYADKHKIPKDYYMFGVVICACKSYFSFCFLFIHISI